MTITKNDLADILMCFTKEDISSFRSGAEKIVKQKMTKTEAAQAVANTPSVTKNNLRHFIFSRFDTERFRSFIFESDTSFNNPFNGFNANLNGIQTVSESSLSANGFIEAFVLSPVLCIENYDANSTDMNDYLTDDDYSKINFKTPIRIEFFGKFIIIKFFTLIQSSRFTKSDGTELFIHKQLIDYPAICSAIRTKLQQDFQINVTISNLTSGIKYLVQNKKIDAVMVSCDDAQNEGQNIRKLHKGSSKNFVAFDWYNSHDFFTTDRINPTNWYWTHAQTANQRPEHYENLWIDCPAGIIKKGKTTDNDLNFFIQEILNHV